MDKRDKIRLQGMTFHGHHGLMEAETKLGQIFKVDLVLVTDLKLAGQTDKMGHSIHYGEVYDLVKSIVEGTPFKLLESLAETLAQEVLQTFNQVEEVLVRVNKPQAPIPGVFDNVAVEITRARH